VWGSGLGSLSGTPPPHFFFRFFQILYGLGGFFRGDAGIFGPIMAGFGEGTPPLSLPIHPGFEPVGETFPAHLRRSNFVFPISHGGLPGPPPQGAPSCIYTKLLSGGDVPLPLKIEVGVPFPMLFFPPRPGFLDLAWFYLHKNPRAGANSGSSQHRPPRPTNLLPPGLEGFFIMGRIGGWPPGGGSTARRWPLLEFRERGSPSFHI